MRRHPALPAPVARTERANPRGATFVTFRYRLSAAFSALSAV
ncbi:MAG TPA: hypothetical protein VGL47_40095 [Amycolatopsis sp.]